MNIFSKNIFTVTISSILCLGTIAPVLAQKQKRQPQTTVGSKLFYKQHGKRQYYFRQRLFREAVATKKNNADHSSEIERDTFDGKENKSMSAMNIESENNRLAKPKSKKQQSPYGTRSASKKKNQNAAQKVTSNARVTSDDNGKVLRISLRREKVNEPVYKVNETTLPNGVKGKVLTLNTPQLNPAYSVQSSDGQIVKFLGSNTVQDKNVIDLTK